MRTRRVIGSLIMSALAATSLTVVATAPAATAAETVQTRIVSGSDGRGVFSSYSKPLAYGDSISISVNVEGLINGVWEQIYNGPVTVTQQLQAGSAASTVAQSSSAYVYDSIPARGNATYTVSYGGGSGGYPEVNYAPVSAAWTVAVQRDVTTSVKSGRKAALYHGKITPRAGKAVVQIKKSKHAKWKKFHVVKVKGNRAWGAKVRGPLKGYWYYRVVVPAGGGFAMTVTAPTAIHRVRY